MCTLARCAWAFLPPHGALPLQVQGTIDCILSQREGFPRAQALLKSIYKHMKVRLAATSSPLACSPSAMRLLLFALALHPSPTAVCAAPPTDAGPAHPRIPFPAPRPHGAAAHRLLP